MGFTLTPNNNDTPGGFSKKDSGTVDNLNKVAFSKPTDKNRQNVGRGGADVVLDETDEKVTTRDTNLGNVTRERVTQTVEKGFSKQQQGNIRTALEQGDYDAAASAETFAFRQGAGRLGTKTYERMSGNKGGYALTGSTIAGTQTRGGFTQFRTLDDGSKVVREAGVNKIKKKGLMSPKIKSSATTADLKKLAPRRRVKPVSQIKRQGFSY